MQKITTFLWYDGKAEEAAKQYVAIFEGDSKITNASPMSVNFRLHGQEFIALNGGPQYKFTEAISLFVSCKDQNEIDHYWEKLSAGGEKSQCGWLKDRYGLSWQIVPEGLGKWIQNPNALQAMLKMTKLDIATLRKAAEVKP